MAAGLSGALRHVVRAARLPATRQFPGRDGGQREANASSWRQAAGQLFRQLPASGYPVDKIVGPMGLCYSQTARASRARVQMRRQSVMGLPLTENDNGTFRWVPRTSRFLACPACGRGGTAPDKANDALSGAPPFPRQSHIICLPPTRRRPPAPGVRPVSRPSGRKSATRPPSRPASPGNR